jgi:LPS sulfotransferase NodH
MLNILIFHLPASGSTWLQSMLTSNSLVTFDQTLSKGGAPKKNRKRFRESFENPGASRVIGHKGFPASFGSSPEEIAEMLRGTKTLVVFVERKNIVKAAISNIRSKIMKKEEGVRFPRKEGGMKPFRPTRINPKELLSYMRSRQSKTDFVNRVLSHIDDDIEGVSVAHVSYESIYKNPEKEVRRLWRLMRLPNPDKEKIDFDKWVKNTSDSLSDSVTNVGELRRALLSSKYRSMSGMLDE